MGSRQSLARWLTVCAAAVALLALLVPGAAQAHPRGGGAPQPPTLEWGACDAIPDANPRAQCATAIVPKDYRHPSRGTLELAVARLPATDAERRVGSLFVNFGGPGGTAADRIATEPDPGEGGTFSSLNDRFDIVGVDPRGVGMSRPAIDCRANQETEGVYAQPFERPEILDVRAMIGRDVDYIARCVRLNRDILPYVSTADFARDLDGLRQAVGDEKMNYLGFSYGTFLGATYVSLFPDRVRAAVLDGALDPDQYVNDPLAALEEQNAGFERAIGRFLMACARDQVACAGFGGEDPWDGLDLLIERAYAEGIPTGDPATTIDGDDVNAAVVQAVYAKQLWPFLARALAAAERGDGSRLRQLVEIFYGDNGDGTYDPITDRYFTIGALEQRYPRDIRTYLREGKRSYQVFDHSWWNHGYVEAAWGLYPFDSRSAFHGPFANPAGNATTLVVGTTYDPATPYKESRRLVQQLGNASLLTMRGDGHTAYGDNSECIDDAVDAYLEDGVVPAAGTSCRQEVPFEQPQPAPAPAAGEGGDVVAPAALAAPGTPDGPAVEVAPHVKPRVVR